MKKIIGLLTLILGCVVVLVSCSKANNELIGSSSSTTIEENKKRGSVSKYEYPHDGTYQRATIKKTTEEIKTENPNLVDVYNYIDFEIATVNQTPITIKDGKIVAEGSYNSYSEIIMLSSDTFIMATDDFFPQWNYYDTDKYYILHTSFNNFYYVLGK